MSHQPASMIRTTLRGGMVAGFAAVCAAACIAEPEDRERVIGIVADSTTADLVADGRVTLPNTVTAGEAAEITILTTGLSGCWQAGETEVSTENGIRVTPFDLRPGPGYALSCDDVPVDLWHTASVTFEEPGDRVLRVRGRAPSSDGSLGQRVTVVFEIPVQVQ